MKEIGLYGHNLRSYQKIKEAFKNQNIVGIIHATGTGKTYNAFQIILDNQDKKIYYITPQTGIIEHVENAIRENPNLSQEDFKNVEFKTYQSFNNKTKDELKNMDVDILILDESHHSKAPIWGNRINQIIMSHPNLKVFRMSAYENEEDKNNPEWIVSRYDLIDAIIDQNIPRPIYKTALNNLEQTVKELKEVIKRKKLSEEDIKIYTELMREIDKDLEHLEKVDEIIKYNIKPNAKLIYFCPISNDKDETIEKYQKESLKWFNQITTEDNIVFYKSTSSMGKEGKENREAFYHDIDMQGSSVKDKLRVMFCINQYNEGIHAPNVDGVIMGRNTTSEIVFFEQLGRALSVKGNHSKNVENYRKKTVEELKKECDILSIYYKKTDTKDILINKLLSPVIIDLAGNIEYMKLLEQKYQDKLKELNINKTNNKFDISIFNEGVYDKIKYVRDRLNTDWFDKYYLAKAYYEKNKNLKLPEGYKTINGTDYDEYGINLFEWIKQEKAKYYKSSLTDERIKLLEAIGVKFYKPEKLFKWDDYYRLAEKYYNYYGNIDVPERFKTKNGIELDSQGYFLSSWLYLQKKLINNDELNEIQVEKLNKIGIKKQIKIIKEYTWEESYKLATNFYKKYRNLAVPIDFKTIDGITYNKEGLNLYKWIIEEKHKIITGHCDLNTKHKLSTIGIKFEKIVQKEWYQVIKIIKKYYEIHGNLNNMIEDYKSTRGTYNPEGLNIYRWLDIQRTYYHLGYLTSDCISELESMNFDFNYQQVYSWDDYYNLVKSFYLKYPKKIIPFGYKTIDGITYTKNGLDIYEWIFIQKENYNNLSKEEQDKLSEIKLLELYKDQINEYTQIDRTKNWEIMYNLLRMYYLKNGNTDLPTGFRTYDGINYDECGPNLVSWLGCQKKLYHEGKLSDNKIKLLQKININFERKNIKYDKKTSRLSWDNGYALLKKYYDVYKDLDIPENFTTKNGYEYDESGINIYKWYKSQIDNLRCKNLNIIKEEKMLQLGVYYQEKLYLALCKNYLSKNPGSKISLEFTTIDGITENKCGYKVGYWYNNYIAHVEISNFKDKYKIPKSNHELKLPWLKYYEIIKEYYIINGNIDFPLQATKTPLNIDYTNPNIQRNIKIFINNQIIRKNNNAMSIDMEDMLKSIGINFNEKLMQKDNKEKEIK